MAGTRQVVDASAPVGHASNSVRERLLQGAPLLLIFGIALLTRQYYGVIHDARIYIGRALADLHPASVGQEIMFLHDSQSEFTVFTPLIRFLVALFGPGNAAIGIGFVGLFAWSLAVLFLSRRLTFRSVPAWVCAAVALLGDAWYGSLRVFRYAESFATPRPYAEAAVMVALGLLSAGRLAWAGALLAIAAVVHPLTAITGLGVAGVFLVWTDRRRLAAVALACCAGMLAAALHLPLFERLFTVPDPAWLSVIRSRDSYLFLTAWSLGDWAHLVAQALIVVCAITRTSGPIRKLLVSVLVTAAGGLLLTAVTDWFPSLLLIQLQPWRATWLVSLLGNLIAAPLVVELWRSGPRSRILASSLAVASFFAPAPELSLVCSLVAVALLTLELAKIDLQPSALLAKTAVAVGAGFALFSVLTSFAGWFIALNFALRSHAPVAVLNFDPFYAALAFGLAAAMLVAARAPLKVTIAVLSVVAGIGFWDRRREAIRTIEDGGAVQLMHVTAAERRPLIMLGNDDALALHIPSWVRAIQGAGVPFSRDLAMEWSRREQLLIKAGLVRAIELGPHGIGPLNPLPVNAAQIFSACLQATDLGGVLVPADMLIGAVPDQARIWTPPAPTYIPETRGEGHVWVRRDRYYFLQCPVKNGWGVDH